MSIKHFSDFSSAITPNTHLLVSRHGNYVAVVTCDITVPNPATMAREDRLLDVLLKVFSLFTLVNSHLIFASNASDGGLTRACLQLPHYASLVRAASRQELAVQAKLALEYVVILMGDQLLHWLIIFTIL